MVVKQVGKAISNLSRTIKVSKVEGKSHQNRLDTEATVPYLCGLPPELYVR